MTELARASQAIERVDERSEEHLRLMPVGEMAQEWPAAELHVIAGAGHASGPGMGETIVEALDRDAGRNA